MHQNPLLPLTTGGQVSAKSIRALWKTWWLDEFLSWREDAWVLYCCLLLCIRDEEDEEDVEHCMFMFMFASVPQVLERRGGVLNGH